MKTKQILDLIQQENLNNPIKLKAFVQNKRDNLDLPSIIELANNNREKHSAYYTNDFIIEEIMDLLPDFDQDEISIVEPSVGVGKFLPHLFKKYQNKKVKLLLIDIDQDILDLLPIIYDFPPNFDVTFLCADFMSVELNKVDLIIGNPPFTKVSKKCCDSKNLAGGFLEKSCNMAKVVSLIMPKNLLSTPDYANLRAKIANNVQSIIDFGERGFKGVLIETINVICSSFTSISSLTAQSSSSTSVLIKSKDETIYQNRDYIFNNIYWIIYRNAEFDAVFNKMKFGVFDVFRDRQITTSLLKKVDLDIESSEIPVLKSQNIADGFVKKEPINTISLNSAKKLAVYKYLDQEVYLTPNMTYKPRMAKKEKGYLVNGSVAILIPKYDLELTEEQMLYFSSDEFRRFYAIARNRQTRSLNIDQNSVYWFGLI